MIREILKLGNPSLYERSEEVRAEEKSLLPSWVADLHDTLMEYRRTYGAGRAIAAPQIGVKKRLLYMHTDKPYIFVNPTLSFPDGETYELLDDCMSFPGLMVKVRRYKRAVITYLDENFMPQSMKLEGDLSELLQHEYDHLDGILATMRAVDEKSFFMMEMKRELGSV
jgi:peptide deformylase